MISIDDVFVGIINLDDSKDGYKVAKILEYDLNIPKDQINVVNFKRPSSNVPCAHITSLNHNHQKVISTLLC